METFAAIIRLVRTAESCGLVDSFPSYIRTMHSTRNGGTVKVGNLSLEGTNQARLGVIRVVQKMFSDTVQAISRGKQHSSWKLCSVVNDDLLCIGGQITHGLPSEL